MARLIRIAKPARSSFDSRLSPEQEAARVAQSKRDRKKTIRGIVSRAAPVTRNGLPIWGGLKSKNGAPRAVIATEVRTP